MRVVKAFDYSVNGFTKLHLEPGEDPSGVPAQFIPGLLAEGYLQEGAPENKIIKGAPETGVEVALSDNAEVTVIQAAAEPVVEAAAEADEAASAVEQADAADKVADAAEGLSEGADGADAPEAAADEAVEAAAEAAPQPEGDAYPHLSDAQEQALDRDDDGKPGGKRKKA